MDPKLADLTQDGNFRAKVAAVIADMHARGYDVKIFEAKRTIGQQRQKVALGYSKTMKSFHLKRGSDGGAMAADVADIEKAWGWGKREMFMMGSSAMAHGLGWGGLFGLTAKGKAAVVSAIKVLRQANWPLAHPAYRVILGWDEAHLQSLVNWP